MKNFVTNYVTSKGFTEVETNENGTIYTRVDDIECLIYKMKDGSEALKLSFVDKDNNSCWRKISFDKFNPQVFDGKLFELKVEQEKDKALLVAAKKIVEKLRFIKGNNFEKDGETYKLTLAVNEETLLKIDEMLANS